MDACFEGAILLAPTCTMYMPSAIAFSGTRFYTIATEALSVLYLPARFEEVVYVFHPLPYIHQPSDHCKPSFALIAPNGLSWFVGWLVRLLLLLQFGA
jgi:hypothetical protein